MTMAHNDLTQRRPLIRYVQFSRVHFEAGLKSSPRDNRFGGEGTEFIPVCFRSGNG